jgi:acyl-coenzyme A synthetase/AMP-(fatty) acid ligase
MFTYSGVKPVPLSSRTRPGEGLDLKALQGHLSGKLAKYKIPTVLLLVPEIPKNHMGKVRALLRTSNACVCGN